MNRAILKVSRELLAELLPGSEERNYWSPHHLKKAHAAFLLPDCVVLEAVSPHALFLLNLVAFRLGWTGFPPTLPGGAYPHVELRYERTADGVKALAGFLLEDGTVLRVDA